MKVVSTEGLTKLIQLVKSAFVKVEDVVETQEVTLATVATSGSYNDLTDKPNLRNIGEIVASTIPLSDAGLHLLDGALISGSGSYADFVTYISGLVSDYPDLFETEANWQTSVTTYGVCGKFVYDSVNNTVRLPKITGFVEGTNSLSDLGALTAAGLPIPNISIPTTGSGDNNNQWHMAVLMADGGSLTRGGRGNDNWAIQTLNANNSTIYGNSSTVQPQSIKVLYYIVLATSTKTQIQVDIDEIATDLNGKADIGGANITQAFSTNLVSNMSDTANVYMSGMGMPSDTYDTLTLGASGASYTAPANGWFYIRKKAGGSNLYLNIGSNDNFISLTSTSSNQDLTALYPCKKGDSIDVTYNATGTTTAFKFIYAQGSESEAN